MFLFCIIINLHAILNNAFTQIPSYVPTDSLKAWYPFNGNANDISGNSMNGSLYGTTLAFVPGLFNQAVQFNNVNHTSWFDVNDYISFPNFNLNNYSVSFWVKFHSNAGWQNHSCYPFSLGDMSCNGSQGIGIETDGTLRSDLNSTTGSSSYKIIDTLNIDMWYNITTVINYSKLYFYVNGSLADTITINANHNFNNHPIYLAMHHWYCNGTSSSRFNGQIDNFGIWNRPLASCEVYQLYSGIIQSNPTVNLGNDTTLNQGSSLNLNAGNTGSTYLWSTGSTSQTINVSTAGAYWVKVTNSGGCYSSDTINVSFLTSTIPLNDTTICKGESITFTASAPTSGSWQYFQDFENTIGNEWSDTNRFSFNSTKVLGPYGNQTANLNLNSLPAHDSVEISFDLYIHDTWDGNSVANGPDIWILKVNNDTLINATFTNNPGQVQSFPQNVPASNPLKTGALITNLPVLCSSWVGSSMYKISKKIPNNSNSLNISFKGGADQNACDESWSIDNVKVKLLNVNTTTQYLWSNGATTPSINVSPNQTTTYTVIVTNGSAVFKDTATVYVLNPQINIGQDTTICKGESVVLTANASSQNICNKSQLPANLQQGLVAYYPFCGNANDESGNGNNGTVNGVTLTTDRFGNANSAYSFDGMNDYIEAPSSSNLNFGDSINYTYNIWLKFNSNHSSGLIGKSTPGFAIGSQIMLNLSKAKFDFMTSQPTQINFTANTVLNNNIWHLISVVAERSSNKISIFVDGNLDIFQINSNLSLANINNTATLKIGVERMFSDYYNGIMDDVTIYNRTLSNAEIQQLYSLGTANSSSYHWSTNDTTQSITVSPSQTTAYTLTVTNGNISCMDTITINVLNPQINNGQDTTICKGESICLSAYTANVINHVDSIANYTYIGKLNNHLYYRSNYQTDWQSAKIACQLKGGHLATISSVEENNLLFNYCNNYSQQTWMGYTDEIIEGNWKWVNGEINCFTNWAPGEPNNTNNNEDYGTLWCAINGWNDGDYIAQFHFILEIEKNHYLWSTNDTVQNISVSPTQTTTYSVLVTNGNTSCSDTITVFVLNPQINIGQDTTICKGESVVLTANASSQNICNKSQLPANLQQGLVAYYPFCGNANDESGNGNNGTVNGATLTTDRFGNANSAYSFDGNNHYINILPSNTNLFPVGNSIRTVAFWTKFVMGGHSFYWGEDNSQYGGAFDLQIDSTGLIFDGNFNNGNLIYSLLPNFWYQICIVYEGSNIIKCYLNGNYIGNIIIWQNLSTQSIGHYCIGTKFDTFNNFQHPFDGVLDDMIIYNRALSVSEIQQLYSLGNTNSQTYHWSTNDTTQSITVTPPLTTNYIVNISNGSKSCSDTSTVYVINIDAGANDTICKGDSVQLQASGGLIYNWSPTTGLSNPNIANPFAHPIQTTTYYVNAQSQGLNLIYNGNFEMGNTGFTSSYMYTPTQYLEGMYFVGNNSQAWHPGFINCNDHTTNSGKMMIVNGATTSNVVVWQQTINIHKNTNYAFSTWVQNVSSSTTVLANLQFKINGNLIGPIFTSPSTQCVWGNFYTQWFSGNDSIIIISILNQNTQAGGNDFCLDDIYFSELKTCSDSVKVTVINPTPINLGNDTTICQGQSKTLTAGSGYNSFIWSTGATTQQITVQNTGTYWVKAISNQGCTVRDTINLTFLPVQSNILRDSILCLGQSLIFNPGAGYSNHLWSTGATTASLNVNQPSTIWLQVKQPNGCVIKDTAIVKYDSLNIVVSSFSDPTCYGGNNGSVNTITSGLYPPFTYSWNTLPVQITQNIANLIAGTYAVTLTDSLGCKKTVSKTLTAPNPVIVSLGNDTNICQGQNLTLQASQTFASYLWSTGASTQSITVNSSGTYWLKGTNATGCSGYDTIIVSVNPKPVVSISPLIPSICKGDSITLTASSNIASTAFSWSNGGNTNSIKVSPVVTTTYTVIGTKNTCKDTATVNLTVNPIPIVSITPANPSICKGDTITLTASSNLPSTTYTWNNAATNALINVNPAVNSSYYVIGKLNQCVDTAFVNLTVKPLPIITVSANKNPICEGESANLTATSNMPSTTYLWNNSSTSNPLTVSPLISTYFFVNGTANNCHDTAGINIVVISKQTVNLGNDRYLCAGDEINLTANNLTGTYLWSNGSNSSIITVSEPGVYWLRVDNNGCIASDTIEMKKCSEIWVPNVFTPNGDGINDLFHAVTTEIQKLTMYIYNRWGEMIFETSDINTGWNGKINGNDAPSAVYYWLIRYNENRSSAQNIEKEIHGSVTLLR